MSGTLSVRDTVATRMATTTHMTPIALAVQRGIGLTVGFMKWDIGFMKTIIRCGFGGQIEASIPSRKESKKAENTKMPDDCSPGILD